MAGILKALNATANPKERSEVTQTTFECLNKKTALILFAVAERPSLPRKSSTVNGSASTLLIFRLPCRNIALKINLALSLLERVATQAETRAVARVSLPKSLRTHSLPVVFLPRLPRTASSANRKTSTVQNNWPLRIVTSSNGGRYLSLRRVRSEAILRTRPGRKAPTRALTAQWSLPTIIPARQSASSSR